MAKLAALSSGLLARKGQARPAMRPQGYAGFNAPADDLGWNDMGGPAAQPPMPPAEPVPSPELPPVLVERETLATRVELPVPADRTLKPVSVATATRIRKETAHAHKRGGKAAFTLRLDAERHLRLRLASAIADESAQLLMIEALDAFLTTMPEVEALVDALPPAKRR
jgi:hypothetical protein